LATGGAFGIFTETVSRAFASSENIMFESCSWRRAVCFLSVSVSVSTQIWTAGGGSTSGTDGLPSKSASRFVTVDTTGAAGALAGSRKEACTSEARGESMSTGALGCAGAEFTDGSGTGETGTASTTGTTGGGGGVVRTLSGASGSKDEDSVDESGATGATGFCGSKSSGLVTAGITVFVSDGFGAASLTATAETGTTGFAGRTLGVTLTGGAGVTCCGAEPIRSPGKRIPKKQNTDTVNSSSTLQLTTRLFLDL